MDESKIYDNKGFKELVEKIDLLIERYEAFKECEGYEPLKEEKGNGRTN